MCASGSAPAPRKVRPDHTRSAATSLILGLLMVGVVAGTISLATYLGNREFLELERAGDLFMAILFMASLLPVAGFVLALRDLRSGFGGKVSSILGLLFNGLLLLVSGFFYWQTLRLQWILPRVEGVFLINDRPALGAELYLTEKCIHEQVWEDPSTWCNNDFAHGAHVLKDGTFTFKALKPGEYAFHAALEQPPEGNCESSHPQIRITNNDPWWRFDTEVLFIRIERVSLPPGIGSSTFLDLQLDCHQDS